MRVEPHEIGSILHIVKRGTRGNLIAPSEEEKIRFKRSLFYANSIEQHENWIRDTAFLEEYEWPSTWPERRPLVEILAWSLMPNRFHFLLQELQEGGISKFMQRVCGSMTKHFNALYEETGTLFQGSYKGRLVVDDADLRYVAAYVMSKNVFELFPGGISIAVQNFPEAWKFAQNYEFSSLSRFLSGHHSQILSKKSPLNEIFKDPNEFRQQSEDMIVAWQERNKLELNEENDRSLTSFIESARLNSR